MKNIIKLSILISIFIQQTQAEAKDTILYSYAEWRPFHYKSFKGEPQGIYIEILKKIFNESLNIKLKPKIVPWKRAQQNVQTGKTDIIITVPTAERLDYTIASKNEIISIYIRLFTYRNHPQINQIDKIETPEDIKRLNLTAVTNLGNLWHKTKVESIGVKTKYVPTEKNAFMVIAQKRADITFEPFSAGNYLIRNLKIEDKIYGSKGRLGPIKMHLLMSKKSKFKNLMPKIDLEYSRLKNQGIIDKIFLKYSRPQ